MGSGFPCQALGKWHYGAVKRKTASEKGVDMPLAGGNKHSDLAGGSSCEEGAPGVSETEGEGDRSACSEQQNGALDLERANPQSNQKEVPTCRE